MLHPSAAEKHKNQEMDFMVGTLECNGRPVATQLTSDPPWGPGILHRLAAVPQDVVSMTTKNIILKLEFAPPFLFSELDD